MKHVTQRLYSWTSGETVPIMKNYKTFWQGKTVKSFLLRNIPERIE